MSKPFIGFATYLMFVASALPLDAAAGLKVTHTSKPKVVTTYWEEAIVVPGALNLDIVTYYTKPGGLETTGGIVRGKFRLLDYRAATESPLWSFAQPGVPRGTLTIDWSNIYRATQQLVRKIGLAAVERKAGWPVGRPGFVEARTRPQPPQINGVGEYMRSMKGLTAKKDVFFHGHKCEVLMSSHAAHLDRHRKTIYYVDTKTHFIWREDDLYSPPPGTIQPPSRSTAYVAFNRQVTRIPAKFLRFPPGTKYILPTCMGHIATPPGAVRLILPKDSAFFGYSIKIRIK